MRLQRNQMKSQLRSDHDRKINQALLLYAQEFNVSSVAAFWPLDGEPDLRPMLKVMAATNIRLALPVLDEDEDEKFSMTMHRWHPRSIMQENRLHIPEPVDEPPLDLADIDILVMPLIAWDAMGNRLGMGAGFYDRLLAGFSHRKFPLRVGAAYSSQQVDRVPVETWDIPLHAVVNENGWFSFS